MSAPPKVGFLGLGIMGAQMAARLVRTGADVTVYNRSVAKTEPLRALGASVASTPAEVTGECDLVFAMLADPKAAKAVATDGPDAAVHGIAARATTADPITYVDCSTVDPATGEFVGHAVQTAMNTNGAGARGGGFLAAPVSGGWRDCRDGTLLFLCGGSRSAYEAACVPHGLDAMGHKRWFLGPTPTDASRAKLMLQVMMGNIVGSLAEMLTLTKAGGLDEDILLDALGHSAMGNALTSAKGKLMRDCNYAPNFQVYLQQKDLRLALQLADELGVPAPISAAANAQYIRARQMGLGGADFAAVRRAYEVDPIADKESETQEQELN
jgi:glyoxylate/succinic semialdehyde reductase